MIKRMVLSAKAKFTPDQVRTALKGQIKQAENKGISKDKIEDAVARTLKGASRFRSLTEAEVMFRSAVGLLG